MQPGTQLGHYTILSALGKGGMGEVWKAKDSKLGREVAIKTLTDEFASDEERVSRFKREARLLASLNHPNIASIYGLDEANGKHFLVLELVEGDTLAEQIRRGPLPVQEALVIAQQIAEALEAAHETGVIHRDLKPANIKVTPDGKVKVLDFGLAKAYAGDGAEASPIDSPTLSRTATEAGVILGTAAYMSPEQARGKAVDKRADIWAFGCVLYEMLTGRQTWGGETVTDMIAAAVAREPDWSPLPVNLNPTVQQLLRRCLEKEPKDRWHAAGDLRIEIERALADPGSLLVEPVTDVIQAPPRPMLPWIAATFLLTAVVASVAGWNLKPANPRPVARFAVVLPENVEMSRGRVAVALSPDNTRLVYSANDQLYLRSIDQMETLPIPGTDGGSSPFFSPNGQRLGFYADGQLKKVSFDGGPPQVICATTTNPRGINWTLDDTIVFGVGGAIMRVSATGGEPETLETPDSSAGETGVYYPDILPDGDTLLFGVATGPAPDPDGVQVVMKSLTTGVRRVLVEGGIPVRYLSSGHLVYIREGTLLAAPFDLGSGELMPSASIALVEGVELRGRMGQVGISSSGGLAYVPSGGQLRPGRTLALVHRDGEEERLNNVPPRLYGSPRVSPDGTQIAVQTLEDESGGSKIWVHHLSGDRAMQLLADEGNNSRPIWHPDGERIAFTSDREGTSSIYLQMADGSEVAERLTTAQEGTVIAHSWHPDGRTLSFSNRLPGGNDWDLFTLSLDGGAAPQVISAELGVLEAHASFSPDGNWIQYYSSRETGGPNGGGVVVAPFPPTGTKHTIPQRSGHGVSRDSLFGRPTRPSSSI